MDHMEFEEEIRDADHFELEIKKSKDFFDKKLEEVQKQILLNEKAIDELRNVVNPIDKHKIKFTLEELDWIFVTVDTWYWGWRDKILVDKKGYNLERAKEHLKELLCQDRNQEDEKSIDKLLLELIDSHESIFFTVRTINALKCENIYTIGELIKCSELDLLKIQNLGKKSLNEIKKELSKHGLCLNKVDTAWKPEEMCHRREKFETYLNNLEKSVGKCNGK